MVCLRVLALSSWFVQGWCCRGFVARAVWLRVQLAFQRLPQADPAVKEAERGLFLARMQRRRETLSALRLWSMSMCLVAFHLDHEISEFKRTIEQDLMRYLRRNADHIAGRQLAPYAALNGPVALLMRFSDLSANHRAANQ